MARHVLLFFADDRACACFVIFEHEQTDRSCNAAGRICAQRVGVAEETPYAAVLQHLAQNFGLDHVVYSGHLNQPPSPVF